jgi:hypothetical protein
MREIDAALVRRRAGHGRADQGRLHRPSRRARGRARWQPATTVPTRSVLDVTAKVLDQIAKLLVAGSWNGVDGVGHDVAAAMGILMSIRPTRNRQGPVPGNLGDCGTLRGRR